MLNEKRSRAFLGLCGALLFAGAGLSACTNETSPMEPGIGGSAGAGGGDRTTVYIDGSVGAGFDAFPRVGDAPPMSDVLVETKRDAGGKDAAVPDAPVDRQECSLLLQDCPKNAQGCYPFGVGGSKCLISDGPMLGCTVDKDCLPGSICRADGTPLQCVALCDQAGRCGTVKSCSPLPGYSSAGYCPP